MINAPTDRPEPRFVLVVSDASTDELHSAEADT